MLSKSLVRYILVGGSAYLLEIGALYYLRHQLEFSALVSVAISFWIGFVIAFVLQKLVTFQNYEKNKRTVAKQVAYYSLLVLWNYLFTLILVKLFSDETSVIILRTIAIVIITSWNYIAYQSIFKRASE